MYTLTLFTLSSPAAASSFNNNNRNKLNKNKLNNSYYSYKHIQIKFEVGDLNDLTTKFFI
jgi:hypothetical protein